MNFLIKKQPNKALSSHPKISPKSVKAWLTVLVAKKTLLPPFSNMVLPNPILPIRFASVLSKSNLLTSSSLWILLMNRSRNILIVTNHYMKVKALTKSKRISVTALNNNKYNKSSTPGSTSSNRTLRSRPILTKISH